jgi:hypothetical protein
MTIFATGRRDHITPEETVVHGICPRYLYHHRRHPMFGA